MEGIRKFIGSITVFLIILWGSYQLYSLLIMNNKPSNDTSIGGMLISLVVAIFKIIIAIILIIPSLLYGLVHSILFSTDPGKDTFAILYLIIAGSLLWLVLYVFTNQNGQNNSKSKVEHTESIKTDYHRTYLDKKIENVSNNNIVSRKEKDIDTYISKIPPTRSYSQDHSEHVSHEYSAST